MPPTPQSPIPRTCSASVARIRSISPGPALMVVLLHRHADCKIVDDGDHFTKVLRKQPVETDLVAVMPGGQVDVFAERIRQPFVLNVGALDLRPQGTNVRRKQTREA